MPRVNSFSLSVLARLLAKASLERTQAENHTEAWCWLALGYELFVAAIALIASLSDTDNSPRLPIGRRQLEIDGASTSVSS